MIDYDNVAVVDSTGILTYVNGMPNHVIKQPHQRKVQSTAISQDELATNPFAALDFDNDGPPDMQSESSDEDTFDRRSEYDSSSDGDCEDEVVPHNSADDLNCGICAENVGNIPGMIPVISLMTSAQMPQLTSSPSEPFSPRAFQVSRFGIARSSAEL